MRTGSWTGPPRGERAPRVGTSSTVFGVRDLRSGSRLLRVRGLARLVSLGRKAGLLIRTHDHYTPARRRRRDDKALTARNYSGAGVSGSAFPGVGFSRGRGRERNGGRERERRGTGGKNTLAAFCADAAASASAAFAAAALSAAACARKTHFGVENSEVQNR